MAQAQVSADSIQTPSTDNLQLVQIPKVPPTYLKKSALALNVGAIGFGLEYAYNINTNLNVRGRFNYLQIKDYTTAYDLNGSSVNIIANGNATNLDVLLEYLPFKKSSFKLVGGFSYLISYDASMFVEYSDSIQFGEVTLTKEDIGNVTLGLDWGGFAPYMGFGFGRAVPKGRVGFGFEIGTYYAGAPSVSLDAEGLLADTSEEEADLQAGFDDYRWLPFIQLRLAIRL